ncbi:hypothetical protein MBORA_13150 [Methanobrevibacter oralis]|uniref:CRISPR system single-strand-specific deoxyribonuclease Cas10/Csm1 (subtype III-A) n=1 Tax=Methanobrevibacter oralis TaxID=66851 RepID=A0A166AIX3_METOA|nr:type III-A CRISPR-associated protein Cas10/Csm1 [Methanobrevibacter oralis]KZX12086.1 hypothetical protein MBORA_13150 [Methanobrevibacter oralis]
MDDYQILKFASLFHDIGKFYQRADNLGKGGHMYDDKYKDADFGKTGAHSKWSADFLNSNFDDLVENLALYHHNPSASDFKELCQMLQKADHHSSKERIESVDKSDVLLTPLTSIFSRISLNDKICDEKYVPLIELNFSNSLNPRDRNVKEGWNLVPEYKNLWNKFKKEFETLNSEDFESVLAVLRKYTSTIPAAVYTSESDISLYDHLKTTTAIANCRYLFSKEEKLHQKNNQKVYKIINGDISGIQNFIYRVNSPEDAPSGMSKRLRGRSLYLTLLCEAIANKIVLDLNLDSTNILFCGGGRFTIIAPNTKKTDEIIREIDFKINEFFIKKFNAELYLALVSTPVCGDDLGNFSKVLSKLTALLNENKKHKFHNHLANIFKIEDEVNYEVCAVCGNEAPRDDFCSECHSHEDLGKSVANAKYLIKYVSNEEIPESDFYIDFLNIGYLFKRNKTDVIKLVDKYYDIDFTISKLNDTNFLDIKDDISNKNVSFDFKVFANNVPNIKGKPLYFNHLAQLSKGANKLGVLKMDVDNLGRIFSQGFNHLGEGGASISRISSLSFYMDLFFSGRINQILSGFKFYTDTHGHDELFRKIEIKFDDESVETLYRPIGLLPDEFEKLGSSTIHINYSGGDDLLVVGPYDDIIQFAQEFRDNFKTWAANNESINISGGITIVSPKFPIGKAAIMADDELEKSKDCGRDKLTVFGEILSWKSKDNYKGFDELFEFGNYLEDLYNKKFISKGFIYSLLKIWNSKSKVKQLSIYDEKSWNNNIFEKKSTKAFVPLLMYKLRLINDKDIRDDLAKKGIKYMPWIKLPVSWSSLRLR